MFKVSVGTTEYEVRFEYLESNGGRKVTECTILDTEDNVLITEHAICSKLDQFVRKDGRKLAFTRAIAGFPREDRKAFWEKYYTVCKK